MAGWMDWKVMACDLKDFRGKITLESDCVLEAESRASGKERQEIVREILHDWAVRRIDGASVLHRLLRAEGLPGIAEGVQGSAGDCRGSLGESRGVPGSDRA
jgi:hypothetical protein